MSDKLRRRLLNTAAVFAPVDGPALVSLGGKLVLAGGWDGNAVPTTNNEVHTSTDGITFTAETAAPWQARHTFGHGVIGTEAFFWGGDFLNTGGAHKEIWKYSEANGHQQVSSDWGVSIGDTILFGYCIHNGFMMVAGGQSDISSTPTFNNTIHKISTTGVVTKVADLPAGLHDRSTPVMYSHGGSLFLGSGAIYNPAGHAVFYNDLWRSDNDGLTWTSVLTDNRLYSIYPNGVVWDGKLMFLKGFYGGSNKRGLYAIDPDTYAMVPVNYDLPARHAAGMCVHNDALHIAGGNLTGADVRNDSYKIIKL